jgi:hypothetical protein
MALRATLLSAGRGVGKLDRKYFDQAVLVVKYCRFMVDQASSNDLVEGSSLWR